MKKLLLLLACVPVWACAQQDDSLFIRQIATNILTSRASYDNLYYLTKKIGGRLAGSPQMVLAEKWGAAALKAAGADQVIMQSCLVPHWVRGGKDRTSIQYKDASGKTVTRNLSVIALGNSLGSGPKGVRGQVIELHTMADFEKYKDQLKGKIVFMHGPFEEELVRTFEAYGKNGAYRRNTASNAARYGAVAVMVRSMSHAMDNHAHTGAMAYNDSFPKIPAVAMGLRDVEFLHELLATGKPVTAEVTTFGKFLPDTIGHNVIGELRGSEKPDEIITVGGHLDSWDNCEGAHDDGAGCVQTIEVLRAFKALGYKPKRTIRFVLFANEENGLRGGNKYAEEARLKNEKHVFALESDAGGFTPRGFGFTVPAAAWTKLNEWKKLFAPYGVTEFNAGGGGADIGPLNRTFNTPVAGLQPDSQRYFDVHHAASDTFEAVNIRELKLGAVNMAALIYLVDKYGL